MIYWHNEKNVPYISDEEVVGSKYISTDLRPVFIEEKYLLSLLIPRALFSNRIMLTFMSNDGGIYV